MIAADLPVRGSPSAAWRRRTVLFLSFLMSGGLLIFPRVPILLVIVFLCLADRGFRLTVNRRLWPPALLLLIVFAITLVRPGGFDAMSTAVRFANFLAGLMLLRVYLDAPEGSLQKDLFAILPWLAVQAVLTVPLGELVGFLFTEVEVNETPYRTLLWLFTFHVFIEDSTSLVRPDGFFFEPGVFQIYLNLYLYLALFTFRRWGHAMLALLAVLCTQSTTGLLIALLLLGAFTVQSQRRGSLSGRVVVALALAAVLVPVSYVTQQNVIDKFTGESRGSSWAREYDLFTGLNVITAHPWLGIGFDHDRYIAASADLGFAATQLDERMTEGRGNTNGLVYLTYSLGIPLAVPFLLAIFRQRLLGHPLLVGGLLTLSFFSESIIFTPFFLMIIFSGLTAPPRRRRAPQRTAQAPEVAPWTG